jgi:hypothetical protein
VRDANTRLASVATDALGKSGGAMLEAIVTGEQGPPRPAAWPWGGCRGCGAVAPGVAGPRDRSSSVSAAATPRSDRVSR